MRATRSDRRAIEMAGVGIVAFAVQAWYSLAVAPNLLPVSDSNGYRLLGRHLADGLGYIRPYDFERFGVVRPTAEFPPGFPALLAVFHAAGLESVRAQRIGLAALGGLTAVGVLVLARRWFSRGWALGIGLAAAFHPALFQPGAAVLAESLFVAVAVALLLAACWSADRPHPGRVAALGFLGGMAMLVRSEGLLLGLVAVAPTIVVARRLGRPARRRLAAAFTAGLVLLPGAWAVRNLTTFTEPVLVSNNVGSVLAGANCDDTFRGDVIGFWVIRDSCFTGFSDAELAFVDESVAAARLRDQGLRYARAHLSRLPVVAAVRVLRTFQLWEPEQQARLATFEGRRLLTERLAGWLTWAELALGTAGAVALLRRRRHDVLWLAVSPIAVVVAVSAATYGTPRFRIAADVPLLVLAAFGVRSLTVERSGATDGTRPTS